MIINVVKFTKGRQIYRMMTNREKKQLRFETLEHNSNETFPSIFTIFGEIFWSQFFGNRSHKGVKQILKLNKNLN